jgi:hypothetical protein
MCCVVLALVSILEHYLLLLRTLDVNYVWYQRDSLSPYVILFGTKKKPSKKFRDKFGHTPLSMEEKIPWKCKRLVIGTGAYGRLPVMNEVKAEAERRHVELVVLPTREALRLMEKESKANAILHVTC